MYNNAMTINKIAMSHILCFFFYISVIIFIQNILVIVNIPYQETNQILYGIT
jgi:hypothetical protein